MERSSKKLLGPFFWAYESFVYEMCIFILHRVSYVTDLVDITI
jgi:hypothetical protein